ncbi:MAG: ATP synthase subunit C [Sphaerochaetaceae bacterium]|nr:ATP synthase subunit C [Sphaerochaetaceae bacterium]NLO61586.1 ATPase [Spirochaetales bacterium]MDD2405952.1 ATP synthase subunit C [Sphaerochaetaceae bacterium]MDD3670239.1 ATP synthase subunit C [Sphaerochaetaceae bacterium]MDD4260042.1 ATP synthase subunit C [Sphaerochaetaceae bacterium]
MTTRVFRKRLGLSFLATAIALVLSAFVFAPPLFAAETTVLEKAADPQLKWVVIAAAIAFSVGAIAAGIAISNVGSAAMGAISEKPEIASQALIFIALAEGLVVFGFITALMILGKI